MIIDKKFIEHFNKNKTKDTYREVFNEFCKDGQKCRDCNDVIYYYDSTFKRSDNIAVPHKKSYLTSKTVDKVYFLSVCEDCLTKKYPEYQEKNKSRVFNQMNYLTEYAFGISSEESQKWMKKSYAITLENLVEKHGEKIGNEKWKLYCSKQAESNSFEYKKEKHGWDIEDYYKFNKSRSVTLENLIKKHGEEIGTEKWEAYKERQRYTTSLEYFIEEYGIEIGTRKYNNYVINRGQRGMTSELASSFFDKISNYYKKNNFNYKCLYNQNEKRYETSESYVKLDFLIKELNIGIEFNGNTWHANPKKYKPNDIPFKNENGIQRTASDIWERDKAKIDLLSNHLSKILIIWEDDYKRIGFDNIMILILNEIDRPLEQGESNIITIK